MLLYNTQGNSGNNSSNIKLHTTLDEKIIIV